MPREVIMGFGFTSDPNSGDRNSGDDGGMAAMLRQMGRIFSHLGSDPATLVGDLARDSISEDPGVSGVDHAAIDEACQLADVWLSEATIFPATSARARGWTRREWVDRSAPLWMEIVTPLNQGLANQMNSAMQQMQGEITIEQLLPIKAIMDQLGGAMLAGQLGQALGHLAGQVLNSTDLGIPMASAGERILLPANVRAWGEDLGVNPEQVRLFLALRESAAVRLFSETPWLKAHIVNAIHAYATGIHIDVDAMQEQAQRMMEQLQGGETEAESLELFTIEESEQQRAAIARLETALALVEGWIDHVVSTAAAERLPSFAALNEMYRRRRASGGPAEAIFATIVGLQLRPRRLRDAVNLWAAVEHSRGIAGRDALWVHPEALPSSDDLDDPLAFVESLNDPE